MEEHEKKFTRYGPGSDIYIACSQGGWEVYVFPVEVGARGYAAKSLQTCLMFLGIKRSLVTACVEEASNAALRASFWIWKLRDTEAWSN